MSRPAPLLLTALATCWLLVPAVPAGAHATLIDTTPDDGARLAESPQEVSLRFDEPVSGSTGAVRVFDSTGARVDAGGGSGEGEQITGHLREGLGDGTYVVTWRVVSADGHPLRGAFVYQVGSGEAPDEPLLASLVDDDSVPWSVAGTVMRWVAYGAVLAVAGGIFFTVVVARGRVAAGRSLDVAAGAGLAASLATIVLHGAEASGLGWQAMADGEILAATLGGPVGISALGRIAGLGAFLALRGWTPWAQLTAGVLALGSLLLTGHTLTSEPAALRIGADIAHLAGAAAWVGGLVVVWAMLRRMPSSGDVAGAAWVVARFSWMAAGAVLVLAAGGLVLAWVEVRAVRALVTPYGWTLVTKTVLVAAVLGLAVYNRRRLVPAVGAIQDDQVAWRRLRTITAWELGGVALVLAATAVLTALQPAREVAGVDGPLSVYVPIGDEGWQANLVVDPNRAGVNEIHVYLLSGVGRPLDAPAELTMEMSMPEEDIGPVVREAEPAGPAHWILAGPELAIPGQWEVVLRLPRTQTDELRARVGVHVNP